MNIFKNYLKYLVIFTFFFFHILKSQDNNIIILDIYKNNILFTDSYYKCLNYFDSKENKIIQITDQISSAYRASFSSDGRYIAFKYIEFINDVSYQTPTLFDIIQMKIIPLSIKTTQAGVPSFSKKGDVAFTVGKELFIYDSILNSKFNISLPNYVNLPTISPDGNKLILNDGNDQLYILHLSDKNFSKVNSNISSDNLNVFTNHEYSYFEPKWSDNGDKISYKSFSSSLNIYDVNTKQNLSIGYGSLHSWSNQDLIFLEKEYNQDASLIASKTKRFDPIIGKYESVFHENENLITNSQNSIVSFVLKDNYLFYSSKENQEIYKLELGKSYKEEKILNLREIEVSRYDSKLNNSIIFNKTMTDKFIPRFDSVYFHQVYDIRPNRSGVGWGACGAASSLMGLIYYKILPEWGTNCYTPYNHYSPYANYLTEIYALKDVTYNISYTRGTGGNTNTGFGLYGWIYRNSLEDTKGYQASLLRNHGISSIVDWNPDWQKVQKEINNGDPFVLLNSLTDAGHYIVWTGYVNENRTGIFNDPYGNKNEGTYPNYRGIRVKYDWPGYNNGYSNLNNVWCFIYMRRGSDIVINSPKIVFDGKPEFPVKVSYKLVNYGTLDVNSSFKVKIFLSSDNKIDSKDSMIYQKEFVKLNISDTLSDETDFYLPKSTETKTHYIFICADVDNQITENIESNNSAALTATIYNKPTVSLLYPYPNSLMTYEKPSIYVTFDTVQQIDTSTIKLYVNGIDVTSSTLKWNYKLIYYTPTPFTVPIVIISLYLKNSSGFDTTINWNFQIITLTKISSSSDNQEFILFQNYPNPFNPTTLINYQLPTDGYVSLRIFDILGKEIASLVDEYKTAGVYSLKFDARNYPDGVYFCTLKMNNLIRVKKMLLMK